MIARLTLAIAISLTAAASAGGKPWEPSPGKDRDWKRNHQVLVQRATKGDIGLYFLGDSLTAHWTSTGRAVWHLDFLPKKAANFGVSADRVQNVLYRITKGELPKTEPKAFVLMLGTNNLAQKHADSPEDVSRGIKRVLAEIKKKNPSSKILLLSILPNGENPASPLRSSILATNTKLAALADGKSIHYEDVHNEFITENGKWKSALTIDHTHLSAAGYEKLSQLLRKKLKMLGVE